MANIHRATSHAPIVLQERHGLRGCRLRRAHHVQQVPSLRRVAQHSAIRVPWVVMQAPRHCVLNVLQVLLTFHCIIMQHDLIINHMHCSYVLIGKYRGPLTDSTGCQDCAAGYISIAAAQQCTSCIAGTYELNHVACAACSSGGTSEAGAEKCSCAPGYYSGNSTGGQCMPCSIGTVSNAKDATECQPCIPGQFMAGTGQSVCTLSPANTYVSGYGASAYSACPTGSTSIEGQATCICSVGYYSVITNGVLTCIVCPSGADWYLPFGIDACVWVLTDMSMHVIMPLS